MPRFYGDNIDTVINDGQTIDDVMKVTNSSACSSKADFGFESLSDDEKKEISEIINILTEVDSNINEQ